jgi:hypothetical protein
MLITTFINICKDAFFMLLFTLNSIFNAFFSMNIFWDGSSYIISVGEILFAFISFSIIFGFILSAIVDHLRG